MKHVLSPLILSVCLALAHAVERSDPRDTASPYGVLEFLPWNHDWNSYHYTPQKLSQSIQLMKRAGVGIVRMDFLWLDIEPEQGKFDFSKYDQIVNLLRNENIQVLGLLNYNPAWSESGWNAAPNPDAYANYVKQVVTHFKTRVKYWEVWNEPDQDIYWTPQDNLTAYSNLLKRVTPLIKSVDPTARVLVGGLSKDIPFKLRLIYQKAGKDAFDIVSIHPFANPLQKEAVDRLQSVYLSTRRVMEEFQDIDKPIWLTEIGAPGVKQPSTENQWWLGKSPTEDEQARWVRQVYLETLSWVGIEKVFWAFFRDTPQHFHNGIDYFGLVREDFSLKPAYLLYQKIAHQQPTEADPTVQP